MFGDGFLYCRSCGEVHHVTQFDQAPMYDLRGSSMTEVSMDDRRAFLDRHAGHGIEQLTAVSQTKMQDHRANDPMTIRYVEVSNGEALFILRVSRNRIDEPLRYKIVPKQLKFWEDATEAPSAKVPTGQPFLLPAKNRGPASR